MPEGRRSSTRRGSTRRGSVSLNRVVLRKHQLPSRLALQRMEPADAIQRRADFVAEATSTRELMLHELQTIFDGYCLLELQRGGSGTFFSLRRWLQFCLHCGLLAPTVGFASLQRIYIEARSTPSTSNT